MSRLVLTPACGICGEASAVEVDEAALARREAGAKIQDAFPDMTPAEREVLVTGTHPACYDLMRAAAAAHENEEE